jgi:type I restriction enzyme, S subunit
MSFKLTIGKVARAGIRCFHNEAIISLKPPEAELADYLFRFLPIFAALQKSNNAIKGSTLNKGLLTLLPIALPPLAEQKRIVAKVDELMALCDRLEAQQQERETRHAVLARASLARFADAPTPANLQFLFDKSYTISPADLRKSIYQAAFDGVLTAHSRSAASPSAIPTGWVMRDIASWCVIEDGDRGSAYPKKADFSQAGHCVFLNTKNVTRHGFDFTTLEWISEKKHQQLRKGTLVRGDIVFTSRGTIGNVAHYDDSVPFDVMRINSGMFILRGFQKHMEASFLSRLLRSPQIRIQIDSLRSGSAQPQLPIREFRKFTAKIPPLPEQRRIVAKVDQLMALVDALETQLGASRATAANLLEALVAGLTNQSTPFHPNGKIKSPDKIIPIRDDAAEDLLKVAEPTGKYGS